MIQEEGVWELRAKSTMILFSSFFQAKQLIHRHRGGSDGKLKYAYLEIYFYNKNVFATGRWGRIAVVGFP